MGILDFPILEISQFSNFGVEKSLQEAGAAREQTNTHTYTQASKQASKMFNYAAARARARA